MSITLPLVRNTDVSSWALKVPRRTSMNHGSIEFTILFISSVATVVISIASPHGRNTLISTVEPSLWTMEVLSRVGRQTKSSESQIDDPFSIRD
jgi:hypothetical protein